MATPTYTVVQIDARPLVIVSGRAYTYDMANAYRTKAAFSKNGGISWGWIYWTHNEPNKHAAIITKAHELGATSWDFGQATHAPLDQFPVSQ